MPDFASAGGNPLPNSWTQAIDESGKNLLLGPGGGRISEAFNEAFKQ